MVSRKATPVGSIESPIICAETDSPYVSAAAAAAVSLQRANLQNIFFETGGGQEFTAAVSI